MLASATGRAHPGLQALGLSRRDVLGRDRYLLGPGELGDFQNPDHIAKQYFLVALENDQLGIDPRQRVGQRRFEVALGHVLGVDEQLVLGV